MTINFPNISLGTAITPVSAEMFQLGQFGRRTNLRRTVTSMWTCWVRPGCTSPECSARETFWTLSRISDCFSGILMDFELIFVSFPIWNVFEPIYCVFRPLERSKVEHCLKVEVLVPFGIADTLSKRCLEEKRLWTSSQHQNEHESAESQDGPRRCDFLYQKEFDPFKSYAEPEPLGHWEDAEHLTSFDSCGLISNTGF